MTSVNLNKQIIKAIIAFVFVLLFIIIGNAQSNSQIPYKSQELSETEDIPVLIKHLPDWENFRSNATFITNHDALKAVLGNRPVLNLIDFAGGTEAVTAGYPAGRLLIVEFTSPQMSIDADDRIKEVLADDGMTIYRRIGNYNAFVFDTNDPAAASALLDQIKYEKTVQWLGPNPFQISAERAFVIGTSDLFISTVLIVVMGIGFSLFGGAIVGYIFFVVRDKRRSRMAAFSDAGGMTRLNLDGFTPDIDPTHLLKD